MIFFLSLCSLTNNLSNFPQTELQNHKSSLVKFYWFCYHSHKNLGFTQPRSSWTGGDDDALQDVAVYVIFSWIVVTFWSKPKYVHFFSVQLHLLKLIRKQKNYKTFVCQILNTYMQINVHVRGRGRLLHCNTKDSFRRHPTSLLRHVLITSVHTQRRRGTRRHPTSIPRSEIETKTVKPTPEKVGQR